MYKYGHFKGLHAIFESLFCFHLFFLGKSTVEFCIRFVRYSTIYLIPLALSISGKHFEFGHIQIFLGVVAFETIFVNSCVCSGLYANASGTWCVHWAYASGTYACTDHTHQELMRALSIRISNLSMHWAYASGTEACTESTHQELMRMLSVLKRI